MNVELNIRLLTVLPPAWAKPTCHQLFLSVFSSIFCYFFLFSFFSFFAILSYYSILYSCDILLLFLILVCFSQIHSCSYTWFTFRSNAVMNINLLVKTTSLKLCVLFILPLWLSHSFSQWSLFIVAYKATTTKKDTYFFDHPHNAIAISKRNISICGLPAILSNCLDYSRTLAVMACNFV